MSHVLTGLLLPKSSLQVSAHTARPAVPVCVSVCFPGTASSSLTLWFPGLPLQCLELNTWSGLGCSPSQPGVCRLSVQDLCSSSRELCSLWVVSKTLLLVNHKLGGISAFLAAWGGWHPAGQQNPSIFQSCIVGAAENVTFSRSHSRDRSGILSIQTKILS